MANNYNQRLQSQNLALMLQNRESGFTSVGGQLNRMPLLGYERRFCKAITPCLTIDSVAVPPVYLRKFTPDGRRLLAFSHDHRSLHIYPYLGFSSEAVRELIREANVGTKEHYKGEEGDDVLSSLIFRRLFATSKAKSLCLCHDLNFRYHLNREFSVFLDGGKYVLLVAMSSRRSHLPIEEVFRHPDLFDKLDPFAYMFFLVDVEKGVVTDKISLPHDFVVVYKHHGVSVFGSKLTIMSRLYQRIYVYEMAGGKLYQQETIGPYPQEFPEEGFPDLDYLDPSIPFAISHIKQRVLSFRYRQIIGMNGNVQAFYKDYKFFEHMIMERVQLINRDLLLLRYEERPGENGRLPVARTPRRLYVFYNMATEEVVAVYPDSSVEFLHIILQFYAGISNVRSLQTGEAPSLPLHYFLRQNFRDANGGRPVPFAQEMALRFNLDLPVSCQSLSPSPYLKFSDFNYESRFISPLDRPNLCPGKPIVFTDQATKSVKFRLFGKARNDVATSTSAALREQRSYIWHPFEPLCLSIQKTANGNFHHVHLHHSGTVVEQSQPKPKPGASKD